MRRLLQCALVFCFSATVYAKTPERITPVPGYEPVVKLVGDVIREQIEQKQLPAFSICLVDGDRVIWADGFGKATPDKPATAATIYRVGSVSKLFSDVALMQLLQQDRLKLDSPIQDYIPELQPENPFGKPITLRQLTAHRTGLVREPPVGHYFDPDEPSLRETVLSLNETSLVYPPEEKTKYSNAGVAVVGYVIQRLLNRPFEQTMNESVFDPLGMDDSRFVLDVRLRNELADGQMWSHDGRVFAAPTFNLGTAPAGNLYSNVVDLGKFMVAMLNGGKGERGNILDAETLATMMKPQFGQSQSDYGIGFHIQDFDGRRLIGHGGAVYGFSTQLELLVDERVGVAAVTSRDGCNGVVRRVADFALRCLLAQRHNQEMPEFPRPGPVPTLRAKQVDGLYQNEEMETARLIERNGRLFLRHKQHRRELRSIGSDFVIDDAFGYGATISFENADAFIMDDKTFRRQTNACPPRLPERWRGVVGQYGWDHNELFVFEDLGQLHCLIEWFYYYPLTVESENEFTFPDYGLYHGERLVFERDGTGLAQRVVAAGVTFERRPVGTREGETFRIRVTKPIDELRTTALAARPPDEQRDFRKSDLAEIVSLDESIKLDIRYASTNNFASTIFYRQPRAFLQRPAAEALARAHRRLKEEGYGLLIHDAYRPWFVTKMFWDGTPTNMKIFVANPANGSRHNRGCAVDLTLYDVRSGKPIRMGAGYDEFSSRSFPDYEVASSRMRWHRELLRDAMEAQGFTIYEFEWWHFDYQDWRKYPILNTAFEDLE